MAAFARPTRIVRGKDVDPKRQVDEALFEQDEERALYLAYQEAAGSVDRDMAISDFLEVMIT
jgi:glycyl-tRNA synthetase